MKVATLVLAFLACLACFPTALASQDMIAKDFDVTKPLTLCKNEGDFLLHPTNRCKYIRCTNGPEPVKDYSRKLPLYPVEMDCPYGTGVSHVYYGYEGTGYNGLTLRQSALCAYRINNFGYGHNQGYGYDQCSVVQPVKRGFGIPGYRTVPHSLQSIGSVLHRTVPHGLGPGGQSIGPSFHGAAGHNGALPYGAMHYGVTRHGVIRRAVPPKIASDGYVDSGYGYKVFVDHAYGRGYPSYPTAQASARKN